MVEVVNVVASGSLGKELNLDAIADELAEIAEYDPEKYPGIYIRSHESRPLITLYRTGKYIITGSDSDVEAETTRQEFLNILFEHEIILNSGDEWFQIQNYVCMGDLEREVDLSTLSLGLGLNVTEYEPEQFPGLVYRPEDHECVMLIFASGNVVVTGAKNKEIAERAFSDLYHFIHEQF